MNDGLAPILHVHFTEIVNKIPTQHRSTYFQCVGYSYSFFRLLCTGRLTLSIRSTECRPNSKGNPEISIKNVDFLFHSLPTSQF